jgi:hypothetical protein
LDAKSTPFVKRCHSLKIGGTASLYDSHFGAVVAETTRLQRLLALKRMGASLEYDDGRKLDDLLEEAKTAIRNLDQSINELGKAS